ncbi:UNVERIFIED_CONTAM: hypothetical protein RKD50_009333 [Streptomyces canus]
MVPHERGEVRDALVPDAEASVRSWVTAVSMYRVTRRERRMRRRGMERLHRREMGAAGRAVSHDPHDPRAGQALPGSRARRPARP